MHSCIIIIIIIIIIIVIIMLFVLITIVFDMNMLKHEPARTSESSVIFASNALLFGTARNVYTGDFIFDFCEKKMQFTK